MISDTEIVEEIKRYMENIPFATAFDIVVFFTQKGMSKDMVLYILKEIVNEGVRESGR